MERNFEALIHDKYNPESPISQGKFDVLTEALEAIAGTGGGYVRRNSDGATMAWNLAVWVNARGEEIPKPGRPATMQDGTRRNIYIDDASWQRAIALGQGNASDGIRRALSK